MRLAILFLLLAAACGDDPGDAFVVVQETNVPDPPPVMCDGWRYHYVVDYVSECGGGETQTDVCADQELCDEQLAEIVEPLASCDELMSYTIEIPDGC
jgi:hypothetical protein